jgi:hypothetical protein
MCHRVAVRVVETATVVVVGGGMLVSCGEGPPPPCDGALAYLNPACGEAASGENSDSTQAEQELLEDDDGVALRSGSSAADVGDDPPTWEEPSEPPPQAGGATRQEKLADGRTIEITTGDTYTISGVKQRLNGTIRRYAIASDATGMVILYAGDDRSEDNAVFIGNVQFFGDGSCDTDVAWGNDGGQWTRISCFAGSTS